MKVIKNCGELIFENRADAETVLDKMLCIIDEYGVVMVVDYYELAGVSYQYTDNAYGWVNLKNAQVVAKRDLVGKRLGYTITLPKAAPLEPPHLNIEEIKNLGKDESKPNGMVVVVDDNVNPKNAASIVSELTKIKSEYPMYIYIQKGLN